MGGSYAFSMSDFHLDNPGSISGRSQVYYQVIGILLGNN